MEKGPNSNSGDPNVAMLVRHQEHGSIGASNEFVRPLAVNAVDGPPLSLLSADFHNKVSRVLQGTLTSLPCCGVSPKKKLCGSFDSSIVTDAARTTVVFSFS